MGASRARRRPHERRPPLPEHDMTCWKRLKRKASRVAFSVALLPQMIDGTFARIRVIGESV